MIGAIVVSIVLGACSSSEENSLEKEMNQVSESKVKVSKDEINQLKKEGVI